MLGPHEGEIAVRLARGAVSEALGGDPPRSPDALPSLFQERRGVFVSWHVHPAHRLRGCVGYPLPVLPLGEGLRRAAVAAALDDPRFEPVTAAEFPVLVAEVSALTAPEPLAAVDRPAGVVIGRHGLIVEHRGVQGLLLPQVAADQGWSPEEFLDGTCEKAGLRPGLWRTPAVRVLRFEAEIFAERSPGGEVVRVLDGT